MAGEGIQTIKVKGFKVAAQRQAFGVLIGSRSSEALHLQVLLNLEHLLDFCLE